MTEVTQLDSDHWATTEDVRDLVKIPDKGGQKDFQKAIQRATDSVQAWWFKETGLDTLPDPATDGLDSLLVQSAAYKAAFESHFAFARNFQGGDDTTTGGKSADTVAREKFDDWAAQRDVSEPTTQKDAVDTDAKSGALIDEF